MVRFKFPSLKKINDKEPLIGLKAAKKAGEKGFVFLMETLLRAKIHTGKKEFSTAFDKEKDLLIVKATEKPEKGKANKEIVKELKKKFKADIKIVSGKLSREKIIKIELPKEQILQILETQN